MKRIMLMALTVIMLILLLPLVILQGIGRSIPAIKVMNPDNLVNTSSANASSGSTVKQDIVFDDTNGGGPKVKVYIADKKVVQEMYLEEYIRGVVSAEMPANFNLEALKAQAIAARTYTVTRMRSFGGKGCSKDKNADICTDSHHCQAWISKDDRMKQWKPEEAQSNWNKITEAVEETKGMILTYHSAPVMYPLYFSTSGGKTENSVDVFNGTQEPYLRSVASPYDDEAPKYSTKASFAASDFVNKIASSEFKIKLDKNKLSSQVKILNRTEGGSVRNIKVGNKTLLGTDIRNIFNLNSANFTIQFGTNSVTFSVLGYGHGVGMSQWGANGMAEHGKKFDEILKYYYQGTEIKKIDDVFNQSKGQS